jgi:hypothetical protein
MAKSKGKFIMMAYSLLELNPEAQAEAVQSIKRLTGADVTKLAPEGWYDTNVIGTIFQIAEKYYGAIMAWSTIKVMGRRVYPTIAKTVGFPAHLKIPLDWLQWEGQSFLDDHQGNDVVPRKFLKTDPGHVVVEAISPGYSCILIEGVYEGILEMCKIKHYKVKQTRCVKKGDPVCEYDITWKEA